MTLEFVAFDIETTGFGIDDTVTVVGFALPLGCRVFCQTANRPIDGLEVTVRDRADRHVVVSTHDTERELFRALESFTTERLRDDDVLLVAYNGERWRAGFDLPFLRTRMAASDITWPFRELPYADLLPVVANRFNTTVDENDQSDLDGAYEALIDGDLGALDPFTDSQAAVTAFEDEEFADLVMHNVADVLRTRALGALTQQYCSKSDFRLKSLTPTIHD